MSTFNIFITASTNKLAGDSLNSRLGHYEQLKKEG